MEYVLRIEMEDPKEKISEDTQIEIVDTIKSIFQEEEIKAHIHWDKVIG